MPLKQRSLEDTERGRRHYAFDVGLSRSKQRTVGGGLPAMNDDAIFLIYRANPVVGLPHRPSPSLNQPSCRRASF